MKEIPFPYGYYRVGNEIITHKISALIRSKQLGITPTWHFHSDIYSRFDWSQDLPFDLKHYYYRRAQQLREKYEYLVLSFSGGSDSWTVLKSFVDSGTHLDEVYVRWPIQASQGRYTVSQDLDPANILSEWDLTIRPMIQQYQQLMPHTKFTVLDWSDNITSRELTDDDWLNVQDAINPGVHFKYNSIGAGELQAMHAGKHTAIIFGADKPQLLYKNGEVYCYFLDKFANVHPGNSFKRNCELFYWTPELPELVVAQSRYLFRYLQSNTNALNLIDWSMPFSFDRKYLWDQVVKHVIYNDYAQLNVFQAKKPTTTIHDESDAFYIKEVENLRYLQSWESGLKNIFNSIDSKYIQKRNGVPIGFTGFIDGMYCLGHIKDQSV